MAAQTRRARYVGSLREAQREVALAREEVAKAQEKTWGYQELLQSAGTVDGPDCSPVGPLPTPAKSSRRLSLLNIMRPSAKKSGGSVAPSPAALSTTRRMSILDVDRSEFGAPKKEESTLGLMSAALGPRLSEGKLRVGLDLASAENAPSQPARLVLSPRGANASAATTPRYGKKGDSSVGGTPSSTKGSAHNASAGTGTPPYGSSKKLRASPTHAF